MDSSLSYREGRLLSTHVPRIEKLRRSLVALQEFLEKPANSKLDHAGIVFGFVVAFEHAWKCLEDRVSDLGYATRKIKPILDTILKAGLIPASDEKIWMQMLEDKNLSWHVYDEDQACELAGRIRSTHLEALDSLYHRLRGR
ncbi:MAG: HI0074 family nucleotidyltransferase substrate-binding subunit [Fimbriimonas sp.]|nr:HI0074 family nucleotidyltransferase substrate-binding subunit [Fimbriimonas sp.]